MSSGYSGAVGHFPRTKEIQILFVKKIIKTLTQNNRIYELYCFTLFSNQITLQMKVIQSRITEQPKSLFDPIPRVYVTLENGVEEFLFDYYPDEISFTPSEFIGLTIEECRHLKFKKDKHYLTS